MVCISRIFGRITSQFISRITNSKSYVSINKQWDHSRTDNKSNITCLNRQEKQSSQSKQQSLYPNIYDLQAAAEFKWQWSFQRARSGFSRANITPQSDRTTQKKKMRTMKIAAKATCSSLTASNENKPAYLAPEEQVQSNNLPAATNQCRHRLSCFGISIE